jgi:UDP-N-acetylmuramyl pentapeptide phosphotransferase/UDP-N-acetylglucosamine-1-phosphate transferase
LLLTGFGAAVFCYCLTGAILPLLKRVALSRPNQRSSHREPTPQGGGIAVIAATVLLACLAAAAVGVSSASFTQLAMIGGAAVFLACVGAADDIKSLPAIARLLAQVIAAAAVLAALPDALIPSVPYWIDRAVLLLALVWMINLTNFMDGIDWMSVAEIVPVTAALALLGWQGILPGHDALLATALLGAMIGFAPWNKPVARIFLGDTGSLPIGLILGGLLIILATQGHGAAALLLPLYYLADATITLLTRLRRGARLWQAHRDHFYQRAIDAGTNIGGVLTRVLATNILLAILAIGTVWVQSRLADAVAIASGGLLVASLLASLDRGRG